MLKEGSDPPDLSPAGLWSQSASAMAECQPASDEDVATASAVAERQPACHEDVATASAVAEHQAHLQSMHKQVM